MVNYTAPEKISSVETRQAYPWTLQEDGSLMAGNQGASRSYSYLKVVPEETGILHFQYKTSTYAYSTYAYDYLSWGVVSSTANDPTGTPGGDYKALDYGGVHDWTDSLAIPVKAGQEVRIFFYNYYAYTNDDSGNPLENQVWVRNIELETSLVDVSFVSDHPEWGTVEATSGVTDGKAALGDTITLKATAGTGQYVGWYDATGKLISTAQYIYPVIMEANQSYVAKFAPPLTGTAIADIPTKNYIKFGDLDTALSFAESGDTVRILDNFTLTKNTTIPSGVTLLIPLSATDTSGYKSSGDYSRNAWIAPGTYLYKTFTVNSGVTLTVNGYIKLGATLHQKNQTAQGHISGAYSQIVNNGNIVINSNSKSSNRLLGLVTGTGTLTMNAGSSLNIPFQVLDYSGGTNTESLYNSGEFPFRQFATNNIQCKFVQKGGSYLYGDTSLYFWSSIHAETIDLVCPSSGLIYLPSGSTLTYTYDQSKAVNHTSGTNCNDFGKTTITVDGNATMGRFYIEGYGSTGKYLNLPWTYDVVVNSGTTTIGYWLRVMPGAKLTVNEDATLNVTGRLVAPEGWHNLAKSGKLYPTMTAITAKGMKAVGEIVVNGTMNVNSGAYFAGIAETTGANGKIVTNANAVLTGQTFTTGSTGGYTNDRTTYTQNARIYGWSGTAYTLVNMEKGKTYTFSSNTNSALSEAITHKNSSGTLLTSTPSPITATINGTWGTDCTVTFHQNDTTGAYTSTATGTMANLTTVTGKANTLPASTFTRTGYTFKGWNTKADGTGTAYTDEQANVKFAADTTLYAQWELNTYTVTWKNINGETLKTDENVAYGTVPTYVGETPTKDATEDHTYTFSGWTPELAAVTEDVSYTATFEEAEQNYRFDSFVWSGSDADGYTAKAMLKAGIGEFTKSVDATVTAAATNATCEAAGKTVYTATYGENSETKEVAIAALGHKYELTGWSWTGDDENGYTAAAVTFTCKHDAAHVQTVHGTVNSPVTTPATYEAAGSIVYTATATFEGKAYTDAKTIVIPQLTGYTLTVVNITGSMSRATISLEDTKPYQAGDKFTVSCDSACVVLWTTDDASYTRLAPVNSGDTHTFTLPTEINESGFKIIVALKGDVDGDGSVDIFDLNALNNDILKNSTLSGLEAIIADIDGDNSRDIFDLNALNNHILHNTLLTW